MTTAITGIKGTSIESDIAEDVCTDTIEYIFEADMCRVVMRLATEVVVKVVDSVLCRKFDEGTIKNSITNGEC